MTDEQKRLVDKLMNTQHDMVVVIAQSAYAEATLVAAQREIRELREVVERLPKTEDGQIISHGGVTICEHRMMHAWYLRDLLGKSYEDHTAKEKHYSSMAALEQAMGEKS